MSREHPEVTQAHREAAARVLIPIASNPMADRIALAIAYAEQRGAKRACLDLGRALPSVEGDYLLRTLHEHTLACQLLIKEEQEKALPDSHLISTLCESIRLCRENERLGKRGLDLGRADAGLLHESARTLAEFVRGLDYSARRYNKSDGPTEHVTEAAAQVIALTEDPFQLGQVALAERDSERFEAGRRLGVDQKRRRQAEANQPDTEEG